MLKDNNLIYLIFTFLPALIYSIIVYITAPQNTIKWKISSLFFSMGVLSTILVNAIHFAFPNWDNPTSSILAISLFITAFFKIGFLEEISKFFLFKLTEWYRHHKYKSQHSFAIMFYSMSVSCGFAVSENILYAQIYGGSVLFIRSFSSVLIHMMCGLMMGYFIALGRIESNNVNNYFKKIYYTIAGILVSSFYHGLYDFNIYLYQDLSKSFAIILTGFIITYSMIHHLKKISA
jgi:protease PrsW